MYMYETFHLARMCNLYGSKSHTPLCKQARIAHRIARVIFYDRVGFCGGSSGGSHETISLFHSSQSGMLRASNKLSRLGAKNSELKNSRGKNIKNNKYDNKQRKFKNYQNY